LLADHGLWGSWLKQSRLPTAREFESEGRNRYLIIALWALLEKVLRVGIDDAPPVPMKMGRPESGDFRGYEVDMPTSE
jgi:hypothetical protein